MKITLLAHTLVEQVPYSARVAGYTERAFGAEGLAEFAGRACYQSWDRPNAKTASNSDYLANILSQEHFSVLEHGSATFYIESVSRSLTHELIRHRHFSFSELSQRFVNMEQCEVIAPPLLRQARELSKIMADDSTIVTPEQTHAARRAVQSFEEVTQFIRRAHGDLVRDLSEVFPDATRKQVREAARSVLPNATETRMTITGNMRTWREFIQKRATVHADAEICELACQIFAQLDNVAHNCFADMFSEVIDGREVVTKDLGRLLDIQEIRHWTPEKKAADHEEFVRERMGMWPAVNPDSVESIERARAKLQKTEQNKFERGFLGVPEGWDRSGLEPPVGSEIIISETVTTHDERSGEDVTAEREITQCWRRMPDGGWKPLETEGGAVLWPKAPSAPWARLRDEAGTTITVLSVPLNVDHDRNTKGSQ